MKIIILTGFSLMAVLAAAEDTKETLLVPSQETEQSWNVHFQATAVPEGHPVLQAPPTGEGFLSPNSELATSFTSTLFFGASPWRGTELYANPEVSAGSGISKTQGIAAFPNGEIYRVDDPTPKFYAARAFLRQVIGFGGAQEKVDSDQNRLATTQDVSRLTLTIGKFSLPDMFDGNAYSHDPRNQFMNWCIMANGAWDVASDTRGYTWALVLELNQPAWAIRAGIATVPTVANGPDFDWNLAEARGDNVEFEYRYSIFGHPGKVRLLGFANHADMGSYQETLDNPSYGMNITKSRAYRTRLGAGLNFEQEITPEIGSFLRLGWNDGLSETWDYTEMDQTLSFGVSLKGSLWGRLSDIFGFGFVLGGISADHQAYLEAGGSGFMLGGGLAKYAPEMVFETYYSMLFFRGFTASVDYQQVFNPGYDMTRGTLPVFSARLHVEI
jgi:high affinity Mn2+ porin